MSQTPLARPRAPFAGLVPLAAAVLAAFAPVAQAQHPAGHGHADHGHADHGHADHAEAPERTAPRVTPADVRFMEMMVPHHAQALEMTALVPGRAASEGVRLLARRIEASQGSEIALMQRWLARHALAPDSASHGEHAAHGGHAAHDHAGMAGMLTPAQMAELAAASGPAFDRLFLERMISHHEGALTMVAELLGSVGGAQDPETFAFASHVESDQRSEILRMRRMLQSLPATP